jgi:hypothetical protein
MKNSSIIKSLLCFILLILVGSIPTQAQESENVELVGTLYNYWEDAKDVAVSGSHIYVAANDYGLRVVNISDPSVPVAAGFSDTPGMALGVAVSGSYAYVADYHSGLRVINISDPSQPIEVGFYDTPGSAYGVAVSGSYAYVADYHSGLRIINVSNPSLPVEVGYCITPGTAENVAVSGGYAYVADEGSGLCVINISDPSAPFQAGQFDTPGNAHGVAVSGSYAYVSDYDSGLRIINVSDPSQPVEVGYYETPGNAEGVAVSGSYAYVADSYSLRVINISDPSQPVEVGFCDPGYAIGVVVSGSYAYTAGGGSGLNLIDISDPLLPVEVGYYDTGWCRDVAVSGSFAYIANGISGLRVIDISDPSLPVEVGFYDTPGSAYGVTVSGSYAYVADGRGGIRIIDISDPLQPVEVGFEAPAQATYECVVISGSYAYIMQFWSIRIIDISNPTAPSRVGSYFYGDPMYFTGIAISDSYVYVSGGSGLGVLDVSDPSDPLLVTQYDTPGSAKDIVVSGSYAYIADGNSGLCVIDISDPSLPFVVGQCDTPGHAIGVTVSGSFAYVADENSGLRVINISDPSAPVEVGYYDTPGEAVNVSASNSYAYVADYYNFEIFEYTGPTPPFPFDLLSPVDESVCITGDTTLVWQNTTNNDPEETIEYELYIATDETFTTDLQTFTMADTTYSLENLTNGETYWWKVKALDTNSNGTWSNQVFSFTVINPAPLPFSLLSPEDGITLDTLGTTFAWNATTDPNPEDVVMYMLSLSTDEAFSDPLLYGAGLSTEYDIFDLVDDTDYWWKVYAADSESSGTFSNETWTFHTSLPAPPSNFSLLRPHDETTLDSLETTFAWGRASDPNPDDVVMYMLLLSIDEAFSDPLLYGAGISREYDIFDLVDNTNYWWKVYAADSDSTGTFSNETWTFHTSLPEPPSDFSLLAPEDEASIGGDGNFEFRASWEESVDPDPGDIVIYDWVGIVTLPSGTDTTLRYSSVEEENLTLNIPDSLGLENWESEFSLEWYVEAISSLDTVASLEEYSLTLAINSDVTDLQSDLPEIFEISSLYPNPFNPTLNVEIALPETADLKVMIYNVMGQSVATVADHSYSAGTHSFTFDGSDHSSGVYFVHAIVTGKLNQIQKVVLMK